MTGYRLETLCRNPETEFKEFEPRLKYGWFHLKLYSIYQDETGFGRFKTRIKFIKFGQELTT